MSYAEMNIDLTEGRKLGFISSLVVPLDDLNSVRESGPFEHVVQFQTRQEGIHKLIVQASVSSFGFSQQYLLEASELNHAGYGQKVIGSDFWYKIHEPTCAKSSSRKDIWDISIKGNLYFTPNHKNKHLRPIIHGFNLLVFGIT